MRRRGPKPAKSKEAKPPVARRSPQDDATRVRDLEERLAEALRDKAEALKREAEALEQQTATGEILRTIAQAPTDVQPVFDAVAANAARLCGVDDVTIHRIEDGGLRRVAHVGSVPVLADSRIPLLPGGVNERVLSERRTIHISDTHAPSFVCQFPGSQHAALGTRSLLATPLVREGVAIGLIQLRRAESRPFTDRQIALLETFADQAVIAIENVRLFTELQEKNQALTAAHAQVTEALEQQTATAEILRVISSSPTDVQPVFDTIVERAARLCSADDAVLLRVDGDVLTLVAHLGTVRVTPEHLAMPITRGMAVGQAVLDRRTVHIHDMAEEHRRGNYPASVDLRQRVGYRTLLIAPLVREDVAIGAIVIRRLEVRDFSESQIALLQTFADQAVIAIENVRLFTELQASNRDLITALDKQTATSDILRVISQSQTDVQPVFDAIVGSAVRLLRGSAGGLTRVAGDQIALVALMSTDDAGDAALRAFYPRPLQSAPGMHGLVIRDRAPLNVADAHTDPRLSEAAQTVARARGSRSQVAVPLLRRDEAIGALAVNRREPGGFTDDEIALLRTFADQAVIAIENVRMFSELQERNQEIEQKSRELAAASQHKSEFLANMSHELRTPLNAIIGFSEVLSEKMFGELNEKQEEYSKDIHASGQHLLSLINDILDLSKIEAGRMELELTDFDLPQAIDNALTLVRERAGRRGIALHESVEAHLGEIKGDERKIKQVLLNLLSNALKFTREGGRVEVLARVVDGMAEISVTDTGVGIAAADQEAVFEEFRQVGTAEKKAEGTGLGLTLCRKFIELHGGRIWVKSQVGVGSTFTFTVPVRRSD